MEAIRSDGEIVLAALILLIVLVSCQGTPEAGHRGPVSEPSGAEDPVLALRAAAAPGRQILMDTAGTTICQRFNPPPGYIRTSVDSFSFGFFLRHLKLKSFGTPVKYYDGRIKPSRNVYISVIDMDIGFRDLQQCADAIMRLRAEYLYAGKRYQDIHFTFVSDGRPRYYKDFHEGDHSYEKFRKYLEFVFSYANTRSLSRELINRTSITEMQIGDVFIQTGDPYGHAVIVVDMAEDKVSGEQVYILAQSYMPAQDIQILVNRGDRKISPWYRLVEGIVVTPEWTFSAGDLKYFGN